GGDRAPRESSGTPHGDPWFRRMIRDAGATTPAATTDHAELADTPPGPRIDVPLKRLGRLFGRRTGGRLLGHGLPGLATGPRPARVSGCARRPRWTHPGGAVPYAEWTLTTVPQSLDELACPGP